MRALFVKGLAMHSQHQKNLSSAFILPNRTCHLIGSQVKAPSHGRLWLCHCHALVGSAEALPASLSLLPLAVSLHQKHGPEVQAKHNSNVVC